MVFINDLPTAISKCNILLYADDAVVSAAHKDIKILEETLNAELDGTTSTDYLKFQSLEDRRNAHILGLVKRFLNNNVPQFLKNYFKLNKEVVSRETRRSNFVYLPAVRTETAKKSFYYNGSVVYNNYLVNKN